MTALEQLRGRIALLRAVLDEGDLERAGLLLDAIEDDVRDVERADRERGTA